MTTNTEQNLRQRAADLDAAVDDPSTPAGELLRLARLVEEAEAEVNEAQDTMHAPLIVFEEGGLAALLTRPPTADRIRAGCLCGWRSDAVTSEADVAWAFAHGHARAQAASTKIVAHG